MFNRWFRFALYTSLESPVLNNVYNIINDLVLLRIGFPVVATGTCLYIYSVFRGHQTEYEVWLQIWAYACQAIFCAGLIILWLGLLNKLNQKMFNIINGGRFQGNPYREGRMLCQVIRKDECPSCGLEISSKLNLRGWLRGGPLVRPAVFYDDYYEKLYFAHDEISYYKDDVNNYQNANKNLREFLSKFVVFNPDRPGQWLSCELVFDREEKYLAVTTERKKIYDTYGDVRNGKCPKKDSMKKEKHAYCEINQSAGRKKENHGTCIGNTFIDTPGNVTKTVDKEGTVKYELHSPDSKRKNGAPAPELNPVYPETAKSCRDKVAEFMDDCGQENGNEQITQYYQDIMENIRHAVHSLTNIDRLIILFTSPLWLALYLFSNRGPVRPLNNRDFKTFAFCTITECNPFLWTMLCQCLLLVAVYSTILLNMVKFVPYNLLPILLNLLILYGAFHRVNNPTLPFKYFVIR